VFEDLHLDSLVHGGGTALGPHGKDVAPNIEVDLRRVHAREVEEDRERFALPVGIHRHRGRSGRGALIGAGRLLGQSAEVGKRVGIALALQPLLSPDSR
jgi:hypothetical protein